MNEKVLDYLRLGRSHTYPADWLLMIVPFLAGSGDIFKFLVLSLFMFGVHWFSFGENSLHDYTQGYDKTDEAKSHHPLVTGKISVHHAVNAIHWTKAIIGSLAILLIIAWSPNIMLAMVSLFLWYIWGTAYNLGLSKESLLAFVPVTACFVAMGAFGWFMSHTDIGLLGTAYLIYVGSILMFQIFWSGSLKDIEQNEPSSLIIRLGAKIEQRPTTNEKASIPPAGYPPAGTATDTVWREYFEPDKALYLGAIMKFAGIVSLVFLAYVSVGAPIDLTNFDTVLKIGWTLVMIAGMMISMLLILPSREWKKARELKNMSIMEIFSIFAAIPLMVNWFLTIFLLLFSLGYFYLANKKMWGTAHPRV